MLTLGSLNNISGSNFTLADDVPDVVENGMFFVTTKHNKDVQVIALESEWMVLTMSDDELEHLLDLASDSTDKKFDTDFEFDDTRRAEREVMHWLKGEK